MRYPELSGSDIARKVGCTPDNVYQVLRPFLGTSAVETLRRRQENAADIYDSMKFQILESVTEAKIAKMDPRDAIVAVGILHDKAALVRGEATGINVTVLMDVAEAIRLRRQSPVRVIEGQQTNTGAASADSE